MAVNEFSEIMAILFIAMPQWQSDLLYVLRKKSWMALKCLNLDEQKTEVVVFGHGGLTFNPPVITLDFYYLRKSFPKVTWINWHELQSQCFLSRDHRSQCILKPFKFSFLFAQPSLLHCVHFPFFFLTL